MSQSVMKMEKRSEEHTWGLLPQSRKDPVYKNDKTSVLHHEKRAWQKASGRKGVNAKNPNRGRWSAAEKKESGYLREERAFASKRLTV